jgi:acetyltransferase-like isoleucine patch superfamily enzyme
MKSLLLYIISKLWFNAYAKLTGLSFGVSCRFINVSSETFGSEPFLIKIGNRVSISSGARFITHDGAVWVLRALYKDFSDVDIFRSITVEDNVFIGLNVIIMPGVNIGKNAVIAAGSIVTKNVPEGVVVAGVPARIIKSLDDYKKGIPEKDIYHTKHIALSQKRKILLRGKM